MSRLLITPALLLLLTAAAVATRVQEAGPPASSPDRPALPAPWGAMESLTDAQRERIREILEARGRRIEACREALRSDRMRVHLRVESADINGFVEADMLHAVRRMRLYVDNAAQQEIFGLLDEAQLERARAAQVRMPREVSMLNTKRVKAGEDTPRWWWAACVSALMDANGVEWKQADAVEALRAGVFPADASATRVLTPAGPWRLNPPQLPGEWRVRGAPYGAKPHPFMIVSLLERGRMIVLTRDGTSLSILHKAVYRDTWDGPRRGRVLDSVTLFDLRTGAETAVPWNEIGAGGVKGWWALWLGTPFDIVENFRYYPCMGKPLEEEGTEARRH